MRLKVVTIVGTRPEIIRLSEIIKKLDIFFDHKLIHTGQNYDFELNEIFFKDLSLRAPDYFLNCSGLTSAEQISNIIKKVDYIFESIKPDAVLILGDTNSSLSAIPAKRRKIPIFHMEAGNRCFNFMVPEEINRRIVDVISDINLTYSQIAREYLIRENFPQDRIIVTGSPLKEVLMSNKTKILKSKVLSKFKLKKQNFFLFSFHREENVDNPNILNHFSRLLKLLESTYSKKIIVSLHPRTKKNLLKNNIIFNDKIIISPPLSFTDYINLQINSLCVFSDSGSITEEASILKFRAINLRNEHERPEGSEEGPTMFVGTEPENCIQAYEAIKKINLKKIKTVRDYDVENVSEKIVSLIISYAHFVKNKVYTV